MSLDRWRALIGITAATAWRMRKSGELVTCNIHGRVYVMPEAAAEFNRRAAAGEFAQHHITPTSPKASPPKAANRGRQRRLAA